MLNVQLDISENLVEWSINMSKMSSWGHDQTEIPPFHSVHWNICTHSYTHQLWLDSHHQYTSTSLRQSAVMKVGSHPNGALHKCSNSSIWRRFTERTVLVAVEVRTMSTQSLTVSIVFNLTLIKQEIWYPLQEQLKQRCAIRMHLDVQLWSFPVGPPNTRIMLI